MKSASRAVLVAVGLTIVMYPARQAAAQEAAPEAKVLPVTSTSPEAAELFRAGLADALNNVPQRMSERLKEALALDPDLGLARVVNATFELGMERDDRLAEVDKGMESMLATNASTGEWLMALAYRQMLSGDFDASRMIFGTLSDMYPDDPAPAYMHALLIQGSEGTNQSIIEMNSVTETHPEFGPAWNVLGYRRWQTGDHAGAVKAMETYLGLLPDHPNANDSYAEIMQWSGRYDEAIEYYNRANEIYPIWAWSAGLAETYQLMGEGARARDQLAVVIKTAPTDALRINHELAIGNSFLLDGDMESALERYESAAQDAQASGMSNLEGWSYLAVAVADGLLGDGGSVDSALEKAAAAMGAESPAYLGASALAWAASGNAEGATRALEGVSNENIRHMAQALIYMNEDELQEAEKELTEANPDWPLVQALLGTCYKEAGRTAEANALRDDILARRDISLTNVQPVIARALASKI